VENRLENLQWKPLDTGGFMAKIGPVLHTRDAAGLPIYGLQTTVEHANAIGLVHGGVLTALLDQTVAMAAWFAADRAPTVTVQLETRFISAAKPGAMLTSQANLRHRTSSMMFLDAEVNEGDRCIALATAIMKISRKAA